MRRLLLAFATAALAVGSLGAPASAAGTVRMVDDDGKASVGQCNGTGTADKKIQKAIDASGKNDTVLVCPGTYRETLVIGRAKDGLTLRSTRPWAAKLAHRTELGNSDGLAVIEIRPGADRVTIQHLALKIRVPRVRAAGVCVPLSGISVRGGDAVINANRVRAYGDTYGPCAMADGIVVGVLDQTAGETPASARVSNNLVRDFQRIGIRVEAGASAVVENNSVRYWHLDATKFRNLAPNQLRHAVARQAAQPSGFFNAVLTAGVGLLRASHAEVRLNEISSGPDAYPIEVVPGGVAFTPRLGAGILVLETDGALVEQNTIRRTILGIEIYHSDDSLVKGNVSEDHVEGITLTEASRNTVRANQVSTGVLGLHVNGSITAGAPGQSQDNRFIKNSALFHTVYDCWDESGPLTAVNGILNTWTGNTGLSDEPSYICDWD